MEIKIQKKPDGTLRKTAFCFLFCLFFSIIFDIDKAAAQIRLNGVLQNYMAVQTVGDHEFLAARNRLRFQLDKPTNFGGLYTNLDLIHRFNKSNKLELLLKEAYFDWYLPNFDLRIGHQKIIWGRANGTFITDIVTPVDLREFLTVSAEDIRFGVTSFNAIRYFGSNSLQLVFAPFFQSDLLPSAESRWFPAREMLSLFSPFSVKSAPAERSHSLEDIQLALRYSLLSPERLDLDIFLMHWTHPTPAYNISFEFDEISETPSVNLEESYRNSWMTGLSASFKLHSKLFLLVESLFVNKKLFNATPLSIDFQPALFSDTSAFLELLQNIEIEDDFLQTKPWIHSMAGLRTEIIQTTIDAQFFLEGIFKYEDEILQEEMYKYVTLLATRSLLRDRLQILTLSRYNFDTNDYWIQFQGQYELDENLQLTVGTNLFGGKETNQLSGHVPFSHFKENSFVFSKIALFF